MINEAIILAGGLGTRLKHVINDIPKPMALINNKPFLEYLLDYLIIQNIEKVILSVGYKHEIILKYFGNKFKKCGIIYAIENEPLGTGGAIKKSLDLCEEEQVFVLNGDTFFNVDLEKLYKFHVLKNSIVTIALKRMHDCERYGAVDIDVNGKITGFLEKSKIINQNINGGVSIIDKSKFLNFEFPKKFSFEKDFLEKYYIQNSFYGIQFDSYFIDIGIPKDYERAKKELPNYQSIG